MSDILLAARKVPGIRKWERLSQGGLLKEMARVRKGNGTTVRRRTKSETKQVTATVQEANDRPTHNGTAAAAHGTEIKIETIRVRAYELFLARGAVHGDDLADWLRAERELRDAQKP
jgi:hypothetical protein